MTKRIEAEGKIHEFPDDATDEEINIALGGKSKGQNEEFYDQHPMVKALGEHLSKIPGLEKAGNAADFFNRSVEATGLPSAAHGLVQGTGNAITSGASLLHSLLSSGVYPGGIKPELPEFKLPEERRPNPQWQDITHGVGEVAGDLGLKGVKPALELASKTPKIISKSVDWLTKPGKGLKALEEQESILAAAKNGLGQFEQAAKEDIGKVLPETGFEETSKGVNQELAKQENAMRTEFKSRYGSFNKGESGQTFVKEPWQMDELTSQFKGIGNVPKSTQKMAKDVSPSIEISKILDDKGDPFKIKIPAKNAKVEDYIDFMREVRDAAGIAGREASESKNISYGDKLELTNLRNKLNEIKDSTINKIKSSISPDEYAKFKEIQNDYGSRYAPLKNTSSFRNSWKYGKMGGGFYKDLLQQSSEGLRAHLLKSPDFKQALIKHLNEGVKHPLDKTAFSGTVKTINRMLKDKVMSGMLSSKQKTVFETVVKRQKYEQAIKKQIAQQEELNAVKRKSLEQEKKSRQVKTGIAGSLLALKPLQAGSSYLYSKIFGK